MIRRIRIDTSHVFFLFFLPNRINRITSQPATVKTIQLQNRNEANISVVQAREDQPILQPGEDLLYDPPPPYTPSKFIVYLTSS